MLSLLFIEIESLKIENDVCESKSCPQSVNARSKEHFIHPQFLFVTT